jgi:Uma2 family endonuclease
MPTAPRRSRGPFRADQIRCGDPYELSDGHTIYVLPAGGRHARTNLVGGQVLATDPDVTEAGTDAGYSPDPKTLRAPDIAVGNVPAEPGWIQGAPPLAVEYADTGQDEAELRAKIDDLLRGGTKYLWVVRLAGPHRVEVYEQGKPMRMALPGEELRAPGVLRNPVKVEALYDREAAMEATLRNLLQRAGYNSLDEVLARGEARGEAKGLAEAARRLVASGMTVEQAASVLGLEIAIVRAAVGQEGEAGTS